MSTMREVEENLLSAERSGVHSLGPRELALIDRVRETYKKASPVPCTKCGYCLPCPNGVDIPRNFELYNDGFIHDDPGTSRMLYSRFLAEGERASSCVGCGACEELCPQGISVGEWMAKVHAVLGEGKSYS
jgi:predicted aldo/keto reductase-like oxidoreductase